MELDQTINNFVSTKLHNYISQNNFEKLFKITSEEKNFSNVKSKTSQKVFLFTNDASWDIVDISNDHVHSNTGTLLL